MFSDLQGRELNYTTHQPSRLLGFRVIDELQKQIAEGKLPSFKSMGIVIAGDLYSDPQANKRGASGYVYDVWEYCAQHAKWVVGVPGNHDFFSPKKPEKIPRHSTDNITILDENKCTYDEINFAGIAGVAGRSFKPWRKKATKRAKILQQLIAKPTNMLILHECATHNDLEVEKVLKIKQKNYPLIVYGHRHRTIALHNIGNFQLLNLDGRVVIGHK